MRIRRVLKCFGSDALCVKHGAFFVCQSLSERPEREREKKETTEFMEIKVEQKS